MSKREFLELAHNFKYGKYNIGEWFYSEKLDGIRAYWDGGVTTGIPAAEVPWANTTKHSRFVETVYATGLWTRYGQVIRAPSWWLESLPKFPLDGELYMGRGQWQKVASVVRSHSGGDEWKQVEYKVFNSPTYAAVFYDSTINGPNYKKTFSGILEWLSPRSQNQGIVQWQGSFRRVQRALGNYNFVGNVSWHPHYELPLSPIAAEDEVKVRLASIEEVGGEGLILRNGMESWLPCRHYGLLKVKSSEDMEGIVVGYKFAKPTDLDKSLTGVQTNKILGLMGSVRVRLESGIEFDLSGFSNLERSLSTTAGDRSDTVAAYAESHPGEEFPDWIHNPLFPRGSKITFKYREMSDDGCPKEARYLRKAADL